MVLDDFHAEFQVRQTDTQHPDWAYVRITNLSQETSNKVFQQKNAPLYINAGYHQGPFGLIFEGGINQQRRGKLSGVDTYHDVLATTAGKAYTTGTVHKTIPKGSTYKDVLDAALEPFKQKGVKEGFIPQEVLNKQLKRGVTLNGMSKDIIRWVAEQFDASWTIFNNKFQMVQVSGSIPKVMDLTPETGLIGIPEQTLTGIVVRILINANVDVGQKVHISEDIVKRYLDIQGKIGGVDVKGTTPVIPGVSKDGLYKVVRVDQDGSVHGQEWYTTLTCLAEGQEGVLGAGAPGNQPYKRAVTEEESAADGKGSGGGSAP